MAIAGPVVLTGAAGTIGSAVRPALSRLVPTLRSTDRRQVEPTGANEEVSTADVRDFAGLVRAFEGAEVVVHLAAIATEATFDQILETNIRGTYHVFEAARRCRVRRVVFASSVHVTGFYPWGTTVGPEDPIRPDTNYAVSKVFGEALGRLYVDKHGLEVVCLRIVGFADEPSQPEYLWGWLSPRDAVQLIQRSIEAEGISFLCVYGVSNNARRTWSSEGWDVLGYRPMDDAEEFADRFPQSDGSFEWQGMQFPHLLPDER